MSSSSFKSLIGVIWKTVSLQKYFHRIFGFLQELYSSLAKFYVERRFYNHHLASPINNLYSKFCLNVLEYVRNKVYHLQIRKSRHEIPYLVGIDLICDMTRENSL